MMSDIFGLISDIFGLMSCIFGLISDIFGLISDIFGLISDHKNWSDIRQARSFSLLVGSLVMFFHLISYFYDI